MSCIDLDYQNIKPFLSEDEIRALQPKIDKLHVDLEKGNGAGNNYLGWLPLPSQTSEELLAEIEHTAGRIKDRCDILICIGIGGSYLGTKAAIHFLNHSFHNQVERSQRDGAALYFAGHNISSDYLTDLLDLIKDRDVCLNVISKSGTTTEPAVAFRILKEMMEKKYGARANERIFATTDKEKGALKQLAEAEGYKSFVIPDDVGGRFSVLTPVGLLPIAAAGNDIRQLIEGAKYSEEKTSNTSALEKNSAYLYAGIRHLLYTKGKSIEVLASFHPALSCVGEWWKQLFGESEGKENRGIFPASVEFTADLHSLGQWIQQGERNLFETFLLMNESRNQVVIPRLDKDDDGLNYIAGKSLDFVNEKAYKGTAAAHVEGGVPNMTLTVKDRSPYSLGQLFYFFERAIAMSGYLLEVNPFDQPGVEFYKKNMFTLLNKPGYGKGNKK